MRGREGEEMYVSITNISRDLGAYIVIERMTDAEC